MVTGFHTSEDEGLAEREEVVRHRVSSASLRGCPDLMAGTRNHHPGRADPFSEIVADGVESRTVAPGYDDLRERGRCQLPERQFDFPDRPAAA